MGSEEGAVSLTSLGQSVWTILRRSFLIDSVGERKGEMNAQWGSLCGSCREVLGCRGRQSIMSARAAMEFWGNESTEGVGFLSLSPQPIKGHQG